MTVPHASPGALRLQPFRDTPAGIPQSGLDPIGGETKTAPCCCRDVADADDPTLGSPNGSDYVARCGPGVNRDSTDGPSWYGPQHLGRAWRGVSKHHPRSDRRVTSLPTIFFQLYIGMLPAELPAQNEPPLPILEHHLPRDLRQRLGSLLALTPIPRHPSPTMLRQVRAGAVRAAVDATGGIRPGTSQSAQQV